MRKHFKGSIGVSMGGKTYKRPKEKGKKIKCKNCTYLVFGYYCNKKNRTAKWVNKPKVCKSFKLIKPIKNNTNLDNKKNKIYDKDIKNNLLCSSCEGVYIHFKGNQIKCSLTDNKKAITTVKKSRNTKIRIPKWCPKR